MILRLSYDILIPEVTINIWQTQDKLKINLKIFCKSGPWALNQSRIRVVYDHCIYQFGDPDSNPFQPIMQEDTRRQTEPLVTIDNVIIPDNVTKSDNVITFGPIV